MKQLVFEITGSRQKADQVNIINISAGELTEKPFSKDRSSLLIDMQDILGKK
jgi:hypothetical protein